MGMTLNRKQVSEVFGCSLPTVDTWVAQGMPAVKGGSKGVAWEFDSVQVHQWLVAQAKKTRRTRGNRFGEADETPDGAIQADEAERRTKVAKMISAEMEAAETLKKVAPIDVISKVISDEIGNARARLLAIPSKFRPAALMHASTPEKSKKLVAEIEELIRDALTEIKSFGAKA